MRVPRDSSRVINLKAPNITSKFLETWLHQSQRIPLRLARAVSQLVEKGYGITVGFFEVCKRSDFQEAFFNKISLYPRISEFDALDKLSDLHRSQPKWFTVTDDNLAVASSEIESSQQEPSQPGADSAQTSQ